MRKCKEEKDIEELFGTVSNDIYWNDAYPDPCAKNFWALAKERVFYLTDEIAENAMGIAEQILSCNFEDKDIPIEQRKPIILVISSPGGYLEHTFHLCDIMMGSKTPVYTVNGGQCCSGAALILMAGHKKYTLPHSYAMLHTGSGGISGTYEQTEAAQANYRKQVAAMKDFILSNTKIEEKVYKRNQSKDWYFTVEDQINYGLVDDMIVSICDLI